MKQAQRVWTELFEQLEAERRKDTPPNDEKVLSIIRRGRDLLVEFTGGNAGIQRSLSAAYEEDPRAFHRSWGIDEELAAYYGRAMNALDSAEPGPLSRPAAPEPT